MVIWSDVRMGQYWDDGHREDALQFTCMRIEILESDFQWQKRRVFQNRFLPFDSWDSEGCSWPGRKNVQKIRKFFYGYFLNKISFLDFSVGLNLSNLSNSPTLKSVLSSPSVSKFKEISQSHLNSVKASPSFRKKGSNLSRGLSVKFKKVQLICTPLL